MDTLKSYLKQILVYNIYIYAMKDNKHTYRLIFIEFSFEQISLIAFLLYGSNFDEWYEDYD